MRKILIILLVAILAPCLASGVEKQEFGITPQVGYTLFFGFMSELVAPDLSYGAAFDYGILDWIGLEFDIIYSEHQETDSIDIGKAQLGHLQTGIGPRFTYNTKYIAPYLTLLAGGNFYSWENRTSKGKDTFDGNGFVGFILLGVDFFVHDMVAMGLAGKVGMTSTHFEFETNRYDGLESLDAYGLFSALFRFSIVF